jgi:hypothetical protein
MHVYTVNIIQAGLMALAMTTVIGEKPGSKRIIIFALAYGLAVPIFRSIYNFINAPFYTHTFILVIWAFLLYFLVIGMEPLKALIGSLLGMIISFIVDGVLIIQIMKVFNITVESVLANPIIFILLTSITSLVFLMIYLLSSVVGITLFKST